MRLQAFVLVLLAATVLAAVHADARQSAANDVIAGLPPLSEWVGSARPSAVRPQYYKEVEKEHGCYMASNVCYSGCPFPNGQRGDRACYANGYGYGMGFRNDLTCCPKEGYGYGYEGYSQDMISPKVGPTIGSCSVTVIPAYIQVSANLVDFGKFIVECTLDNAGDVCGPSGCEDLVLQAQGTAYGADVVTSHQPFAPAECEYEEPARSGQRGLGLLRRSSLRRDNSSSHGHDLYGGGALYLCGPATISSKKHDVKWEKGWFSLIVPGGPFESVTIDDLNALPFKVPKVDPEDFWAYKIDFDKKEGGYAHSHKAEHT